MFKLSQTFTKPSKRGQQGFPPIGANQQTTGAFTPGPARAHWTNAYPTKGTKSWSLGRRAPSQSGQQGMAQPESALQRRPSGSMPNVPPVSGLNHEVYTQYFDRGAQAYVQNYGKPLTNPIGAGIVVLHRPEPLTHGGQYFNHAIWWTSQVIPTSVRLQGLSDPQTLASIFNNIEVQAVVRTT